MQLYDVSQYSVDVPSRLCVEARYSMFNVACAVLAYAQQSSECAQSAGARIATWHTPTRPLATARGHHVYVAVATAISTTILEQDLFYSSYTRL